MSAFLLLITIAIPSAWGVFDGRGDSDGIATGFRRGDQFPIYTGNLLQCDGDNGGPLTVGLNLTNPGEVFKPLHSGYHYPAALNNRNLISYLLAATLIMNKVAFDNNYQSIFRPPDNVFDSILAFPRRYRTDAAGQADLRELQQICGDDIIARLSDSNRNADQPRFDDIRDMLQSEWLEIWANLSDADQERIAMQESFLSPSAYQMAWMTEQTLNFFNDMMNALSCRVAFRWTDAGPTYIPRYYVGGFCLNRNCSMPDRNEFRCHADLSFEESRFFEAARWDCCWTPNREFQCGLRKVRFPIVCDCDCRCQDKAGI